MKQKITRRCRQCTSIYVVSREWQLFCSNSCRKTWNYVEAGFCFYCGEPGGISRDHLHPVAARVGKRKFKGQETVFACAECNSTIGAKIFDSIESRLVWLIGKLIEKYKLNIQAMLWTENEVNDLGLGLRDRIKALIKDRQKAERRVEYAKVVLEEVNRRLDKVEEEEELAEIKNVKSFEDMGL